MNASHYHVAAREGALTVLLSDRLGTCDLNAHGEPCANRAQLREFIRELHAQKAFHATQLAALLEAAA